MSIASTNALLEASKKLKPALKMVWVDKTRRGAVNWEGLLNRENFKWEPSKHRPVKSPDHKMDGIIIDRSWLSTAIKVLGFV